MFCENDPIVNRDPLGPDPIDNAVFEGMAKTRASAPECAILATSISDAVVQIRALKKSGRTIDIVEINGHGGNGIWGGNQTIGTDPISVYGDSYDKKALEELGTMMSQNGEIYLMGCRVAAGAEGKRYLTAISELTQRRVVGSNWYMTAATNGKWGFFGGHWFYLVGRI